LSLENKCYSIPRQKKSAHNNFLSIYQRENVGLALNFMLEHGMISKYNPIGPEDIVSGNLKMILAALRGIKIYQEDLQMDIEMDKQLQDIDTMEEKMGIIHNKSETSSSESEEEEGSYLESPTLQSPINFKHEIQSFEDSRKDSSKRIYSPDRDKAPSDTERDPPQRSQTMSRLREQTPSKSTHVEPKKETQVKSNFFESKKEEKPPSKSNSVEQKKEEKSSSIKSTHIEPKKEPSMQIAEEEASEEKRKSGRELKKLYREERKKSRRDLGMADIMGIVDTSDENLDSDSSSSSEENGTPKKKRKLKIKKGKTDSSEKKTGKTPDKMVKKEPWNG